MKYALLLSGIAFGVFLALFLQYTPDAPVLMFVSPSIGILVYLVAALYGPRPDVRTLDVRDIASAVAESSPVLKTLVGAGAVAAVTVMGLSVFIFREYRTDENLGVYMAQLMTFAFALVLYIFDANMQIAHARDI